MSRPASPKLIDEGHLSQDSAALPELLIDCNDPPTTAKRLAVLFSRAATFFDRADDVVRIIKSDDEHKIKKMNASQVIMEARKICRPVEPDAAQSLAIKKTTPLPKFVADLYLNMHGERGLQKLKGLCHAPLLNDDGGIRCSSGYDADSHQWVISSRPPQILISPKRADAEAAFDLLRRTFGSFPFADSERIDAGKGSVVDLAKGLGADESAFLIALLTAVCRPSLPRAPALLVRAPHLSGAGTGKGLLIGALSEIAFAQKPTAFTSNGNRQELSKRIESALMDARPIVFLDNCNAEQLKSNVLAQVITEPKVEFRPLGRSGLVPLTGSAFIAVSGNDVKIAEDLARRFLVVELDAKCENPEQRRFVSDFEAIIRDRRDKLHDALLTIWRWGRQTKIAPGAAWGSFETWAAWCRDPLLALGCVDPVRRIADLKADDPIRQRTAELFQTWFEAHGSSFVKFRGLDVRVRNLIDGNDQLKVANLGGLANARAGGFLFEIQKPRGRWGKSKYRVRKV